VGLCKIGAARRALLKMHLNIPLHVYLRKINIYLHGHIILYSVFTRWRYWMVLYYASNLIVWIWFGWIGLHLGNNLVTSDWSLLLCFISLILYLSIFSTLILPSCLVCNNEFKKAKTTNYFFFIECSLWHILQFLCSVLQQFGSWALACAYSLLVFVTSVVKESLMVIHQHAMPFPLFSWYCSHLQQCVYTSLSDYVLLVSGFVGSVLQIALFCVNRIGCAVLYIGQGSFHHSMSSTLQYVVHQADSTVDKLRNVSDYLAQAKQVGIDRIFLPTNVQSDIDAAETDINNSAGTLADKTKENSDNIQDLLDSA